MHLMTRVALVAALASAALLTSSTRNRTPELPLPTAQGKIFMVDDFDNKVTPQDMGFNYFAGNMGVIESATTALSDESFAPGGNSLEIDFDLPGGEKPFGGIFLSLFGLTDTLVSLDGSGIQPTETTKFPGYALDFNDIFGPTQAFEDLTVDQVSFQIRLLTAEPIVVKIELEDENEKKIFTRRTILPSGPNWTSVNVSTPSGFDDSPPGHLALFDWSQVSVLAIIVEQGVAGVSNPDTGRFLIDDISLSDVDGSYPDLNSIVAERGLEPDQLATEYERSFLEHLRNLSFQYFLDFASTDPRTGGAVQDRGSFADLVTIGGVGFQLTAYVIAAEQGLLPRSEAADRVEAILASLLAIPQGPERVGRNGYRGFYYHFLGIDGLRKQNFDFTATTGNEALNTVELSTIDTALALAGAVTARQYFDGATSTESEIRSFADQIYGRVEWSFLLEPSICQFYLGWKPNETRDDSGARFLIDDDDDLGQYSSKPGAGGEEPATLDFYTDEALLISLLALASPNPENQITDRCVWDQIQRREETGITKTFPGALFTYQFWSLWVDSRDLATDTHPQPVDLFRNTGLVIDAVREYVEQNPNDRETWNVSGGEDLWGLSATEGPFDSYHAYGAPPVALASDAGVLPGENRIFEGESASGDGTVSFRSNASGGQTRLLKDGEAITVDFDVLIEDDYELEVRYNNDNSGPVELVTVSIDGNPAGSFDALDTGNAGNGWNIFEVSTAIGPESLATGSRTLELSVASGDGFGVEIDWIKIIGGEFVQALEDGTVTNYGAAGGLIHRPDEVVGALWRAVRLGMLHPRFGLADAFNLDINDALVPNVTALRTAGPWVSFNGFAIDHGPIVIGIDNYLNDDFVPQQFMSYPGIQETLYELFIGSFQDDFEYGSTNNWSKTVP